MVERNMSNLDIERRARTDKKFLMAGVAACAATVVSLAALPVSLNKKFEAAPTAPAHFVNTTSCIETAGPVTTKAELKKLHRTVQLPRKIQKCTTAVPKI